MECATRNGFFGFNHSKKKKKKVSDRHSHLALKAEHYRDFLGLYFPP